MRAHFLTNIAAVKTFSFFDNFGEGGGDFFFVFYGEIRNAEAGIYHSGSDDCAGGAGGHAFIAIAADVEGFLGGI